MQQGLRLSLGGGCVSPHCLTMLGSCPQGCGGFPGLTHTSGTGCHPFLNAQLPPSIMSSPTG